LLTLAKVTILYQQTSNSFNHRRIALFEPYPDLSTNPTLVCLLEKLTREGADVDVMMHDTDSFLPVDGKVTCYRFPEGLSLWYGDIRTTWRCWSERLSIERLRIEQKFVTGAYDLILGVDSLGIIRGSKYARRFNVPLVYLSFEIFFRDELSVQAEIEEKQRERIASQFADLVIIQDSGRARLLATENNLMLQKFEYLPVSPGGFGNVEESDYLRTRFNISREQTIVLQSGSLAEWTCAHELLESVVEWQEGFVLVIHTPYVPREAERYVQTVRRAKLPNVFLTIEPLPTDEYEQMVASADIGLVLYKPVPPSRYVQRNIENIGLASGKFSFYMKYGLPVISFAQQEYDRLLKAYAFGENIGSFDEMPEALNRIRSNYAYHRAEAQRLFTERLCFDIHWPKLEARLLEIMK
jgi:hypothetical protein